MKKPTNTEARAEEHDVPFATPRVLDVLPGAWALTKNERDELERYMRDRARARDEKKSEAKTP